MPSFAREFPHCRRGLLFFSGLVRIAAALSVLVALSGRVFSQSDTCAGATVVSDGQYTGSTDDATSDGGATCGSSSSSPDHWYRYTASERGTLAVSTCGSAYDTVLSVHGDCPGTTENQITCNDDTCDLQSAVSIDVSAGADYWIRVSGYSGASGDYTLAIELTPDEIGGGGAGETCADAIDIGIETVTGSTANASDDGTSSCGSSGGSPDRWYRFTAQEDCLLSARTCGSDYDTVLAIFDGCGGNELDCNDDSVCAGGNLQSAVSIPVDAGSTYFLRVTGFRGASGDYALELSCGEIPEPGEGADLTVTSTGAVSQVGRLGDRVALSMSSTICNIGGVAVDWDANPDPRHPFLVFNLFRLREGRMEQIGQSWAKHGFAASQTSGICGLPCVRDPSGGLGSGCADIYGSGTNAAQSTFGRRDEINPWTGGFVFDGSHIDRTGGPYDPVEYRLITNDDDLDPDQNSGARYFLELYVLSHDDVDHENSIGWQELAVTGGSPGGTWRFVLVDTISTVGPALDAWTGASRATAPDAELVDDGRVYVYSRTTGLGDGFTRYEYAVYNLDLERAVGRLSIPLHASSALRDVGSHSAEGFDDGYSNAAWSSSRNGDLLEFSTTSGATANTIRWGTSTVFWFETDAEPLAGAVTVATHAGAVEFAGVATVPSTKIQEIIFRRGDADGDGELAVTDSIRILGFLFGGGEAFTCFDAADVNDDDALDVSDAVSGLLFLFSGGSAPPAPGPHECGPDATPSTLPECSYDLSNCP